MSINNIALEFLLERDTGAESISSERGLQLELAFWLRAKGLKVQFEVSRTVTPHPKQTKKQKRDIDLMVFDGDEICAVELKVPLAGRVPETMYDFYADIAFVEALLREEQCTKGLCILLTNDPDYWQGRVIDGIYGPLRQEGTVLTGVVQKPTGNKDSQVYIEGVHSFRWQNLQNDLVLPGAKFTSAVL